MSTQPLVNSTPVNPTPVNSTPVNSTHGQLNPGKFQALFPQTEDTNGVLTTTPIDGWMFCF